MSGCCTWAGHCGLQFINLSLKVKAQGLVLGPLVSVVQAYHADGFKCTGHSTPPLQDLLVQLHTTHPRIMCYMDEGIYSRIAGLGPDKQLVAAKCLLETEFRPNWDRHVRDGSKYLMGVISKALREAGW